MQTYSIKIKRNHLLRFIELLKMNNVASGEQYVSHEFNSENLRIKIYENTKHDYVKAVVNGKLPANLALYYEIITPKAKTHKPQQKIEIYPQIGSDEVGFGDFFGPLVVVSALVRQSDITKLRTYRITDSKKLSDDYIVSIGPLLAAEFAHQLNIVHNPKYNELMREGYNMNKMKAMLHVNVLTKLRQKTNVTLLLLDEFVGETKFNEYVASMDQIKIKHVSDGENNALSIALASVLARFYFLQEMHKLNERFKTSIPLGAGPNVDIFAAEFKKKHGMSALLQITKHNFRNFTDLREVS